LGVLIFSDSLGSFGRNMVSLPLNTLSYIKATEARSAKAILFLETTQLIGTLGILLLTGLYILLGYNLQSAFAIGAIAGTLPLYWAVKRSTTHNLK
jgi:hypothetical protein